ncbi:MAG: response regulator transcription factor [Betaproteobacteria bacterium]|nr:response regulator transcription factor [Betaproteobacteria bacterium]
MATQNAPIQVFLIDDHRSILWGLERLIESGMPAMKVVGSATNHTEALKLLDHAAPDVIVLDLDLGKENGLDAIPKLIAAGSKAKVLVLTGLRDKSVHDKAVLAGARGVVEKEASAQTILTAIAKVHEGQLWLDRTAAGRIFVEFSRRGAAQALDPEQQKISALTEREREIIAGIATNAGANARTIAESLHISEHTLRNHLTSIYDKLDVANRLELFAYAHKHGLTGPSS